MAISWMITETEAPDDQPSAHLWLFWSPMTWLSRSLATLKKLAMAKTVGFLPATWWVNHRSRDDFFFSRSEFHQRQSSQRAWKKNGLPPIPMIFNDFPHDSIGVTWVFFHICFGQPHQIADQIAGSPSRSNKQSRKQQYDVFHYPLVI